jgi:hypothetical protein
VDELHARELAMNRDALGRTSNPQLKAYSQGRVDALEKSLPAPAPAR